MPKVTARSVSAGLSSALNEIPAGLCGFWIIAKGKLSFKTNMKGITFWERPS